MELPKDNIPNEELNEEIKKDLKEVKKEVEGGKEKAEEVKEKVQEKIEVEKEESEGIVDSIKDTAEDVVDSIQEKKEALVGSIKETKEGISESIQEKKQSISKSFDSGVKKTKSFFRRLIAGIVMLAIVGFILFMLYANWTYSEGTRAGNLIKISHKGYIFKTYEGELKLGGIDLTKEEGLSDTWEFSVKDKSIYEQLEKLQGEKIILRYKQKNKAMPWQGKTDYFIYAIEKSEN